MNWSLVPGFEDLYEVSDAGFVRNLRTGTYMQYGATVCLKHRPTKRCYTGLTGRLVLLAFVGQPPQGMECCHNDGDPRNNELSNLRWDTHINNEADKKRHGTFSAPPVSLPYMLASDQEVELAVLRASDPKIWTIAALMRRYSVGPNVIRAAFGRNGL